MKRKKDWAEFRKLMTQHNMRQLFHFTDKANIQSIRKHGGLYSWGYLAEKGILIPRPGGNDLSRDLDQRDGYQDYVRLCFNRNHPMMIVAQRNGSMPDPVIISVDPEVVYWEHTLFADMNATDNNASTGSDLRAFKAIKFGVACASTWQGEEHKKWRQAEVMVKTHIRFNTLRSLTSTNGPTSCLCPLRIGCAVRQGCPRSV